MAEVVHEKMTQLCREVVHVKNIKWNILERVTVFKQFFQFIWDRILACSIGKPVRYRRLASRPYSPPPEAMEASVESLDAASCSGFNPDSDLVRLKISLLGDCQIGKTSFMVSLYDLFFSFLFLFESWIAI
jgi:Rab family protein